jgi:hypothetical protein
MRSVTCPHCGADFGVRSYKRHTDKCIASPGRLAEIHCRIVELSDGVNMPPRRKYDLNRGELPSSHFLNERNILWGDIAKELGLLTRDTKEERDGFTIRVREVGEEIDAAIAQECREWALNGYYRVKRYWDWRTHEYRITNLFIIR